MKKTIKILTAILVFSLVSASITFGQSTTKTNVGKDSWEMNQKVKMKDGKMMMKMEGSDWTTMTSDMTMDNGVVVHANGTVKLIDGSTIKLNEGDVVNKDGKVFDKNRKMRGETKEKVKEHNKEIKKAD